MKEDFKLTLSPYDVRYLILLNSSRRLTKLILVDYHKNVKHSSVKQTVTEIRKQFWTCSWRGYERKVICKCITCCRLKGKRSTCTPKPLLISLRLNDQKPFFTISVDNFGPFYVKNISHHIWIYSNRGVLFIFAYQFVE